MAVSPRDNEEFAEVDRLARAQADKRGSRPTTHPAQAALLMGIAVFFLLEIFAAIAMMDLRSAAAPLLVLTALAAAAAYVAVWQRERRWLSDYHSAVKAYFDREHGLATLAPEMPNGRENPSAWKKTGKHR